jgi:hypothetical protein
MSIVSLAVQPCLLILWSSTLQAGVNIVSPAVQQQWGFFPASRLEHIISLAVQQQCSSSLQTGLSTVSLAIQQQWVGYRLMLSFGR